MQTPLIITDFKSEYTTDFKSLNVYWLEELFYVEPYDLKVLSDPQQYIIDTGGHIFFAIAGKTVVGTVALIPSREQNVYELTKMAVLHTQRGKGIGHQLMDHCIDFCKSQGNPSIILYSHRSLVNAIHIYKKYGFMEIPVEKDVHYQRADIKMRLVL